MGYLGVKVVILMIRDTFILRIISNSNQNMLFSFINGLRSLNRFEISHTKLNNYGTEYQNMKTRHPTAK